MYFLILTRNLCIYARIILKGAAEAPRCDSQHLWAISIFMNQWSARIALTCVYASTTCTYAWLGPIPSVGTPASSCFVYSDSGLRGTLFQISKYLSLFNGPPIPFSTVWDRSCYFGLFYPTLISGPGSRKWFIT